MDVLQDFPTKAESSYTGTRKATESMRALAGSFQVTFLEFIQAQIRAGTVDNIMHSVQPLTSFIYITFTRYIGIKQTPNQQLLLHLRLIGTDAHLPVRRSPCSSSSKKAQ
jgi:hypothetical protein